MKLRKVMASVCCMGLVSRTGRLRRKQGGTGNHSSSSAEADQKEESKMTKRGCSGCR
ncbi:MAG: hypothetical protein V8S58_18320 [Lachnospiraceae bacterium]